MLSGSIGLTLLEGSDCPMEGAPRLEYCQIRRSAILSGFRLLLICSHGKRDCAIVISPIGDVMQDSMETISSKILSRTSYGIREERVEHGSGYILSWSNGGKCWTTYYYSEEKGSVIPLDANQVLVYMKKSELESLLPDLPMLPLYGNSFEARFRREV